jgi:ABC-type nickel/cobalt efflux system permease component RcnA
MPDLDKPIEVSASTGGIDATTATLRYLIVTGLSFAVGSGWIDASNVEGVASFLIIVGTAGYGLFKTWRRGKQIVKVAEDRRVPNAVAKIV